MTPRPRSRTSARPGILAVLLTVLLMCGLSPTTYAGPGSRGLLTFDDLSVGRPVFNQYPGVTFADGDRSDHPVVIGAPAEGTASGSQALIATTAAPCHHEFFCRSLRILFDEPQSLVELSTANTATGGNVTVQVAGLDASGDQVAQDQDNSLCSATGRTPVETPLSLRVTTASIVEARLTLVACTGPSAGEPLFAVASVPIEIDDLAYTRPLNPPPGEHDPPVFTSISPADGGTATGRYPEEMYTGLSVAVQEAALESLTAQVNGGPVRVLSYTRTGPTTYSGGIGLTDADGLKPGANTVGLTAIDFDHPQNTTHRTITFTFTPLPSTATKDDIRLRAFEVTQVLDPGPQGLAGGAAITTAPKDGFTFDYHPSISLLQSKQTLVRVYATLFGSIGPIFHVPAVATVRRAGCSSSCDLVSGMPPVTQDKSGAVKAALGGITVQALFKGDVAADAADLSKTWDFVIPSGYTNADLDIVVTINDGHYTGYPATKAVPECASTQDWECQHNNLLILRLHFQPTPSIGVTTVLVRAGGSYTCPVDSTYNGKNYKGKTLSPTDSDAPAAARLPTNAQVSEVFRILNLLFPMRVNQGAVSLLDIDVATANKDNLIGAIRDRASDDGEFIVGLLPVDPRCPNYYGPNERNSDGSFTAGFGGVGHNGAWADVDNPADVVHELGHNIGFDHWACENGVTDDECGAFPIPHGGIGGYGTDISGWRVIPPGDDSSNSTPHAHDFMTYGQLCGSHGGGPGCDTGEWVSWYTYGILYGNAGVGSYDTDDPPALSISGSISSAGAVSFEPVYAVNSNHPLTDLVNEDDVDQLYTLQGYDARGNVVLVHNFEPTVQEIHGRGRSYYFREAVPVVPNLARIDLLRGTAVVGSLANPAVSQKPTVAITSPVAGATWQAGSQQTIRWTSSSPAHLALSALVQYSPDGGTTHMTLARNFKGSALTINTDDLPGGTKGTISVEMSDGMNTATAEVGPIVVQPKAPRVVIASPAPGLAYAAPIPVTFTAMAFDLQSGSAGLKYRWSADNGKFTFTETGSMLTLQNALPPGPHTVIVSATDSNGLSGQASVQVMVLTPDGKASGGINPPLWLIGIIAALGLVVVLLILFLAARQRRKKVA